MFGKKPSPPPSPFRVHVLTTEYWIEGTMPGDADLIIPSGEKYWREYLITDAYIRSLHASDRPPQKASQFGVLGKTIVALIPQTAPQQLHNYNYWSTFKNPRSGIYYLGPFTISGTLMFIDIQLSDHTMPMTSATITHTAPMPGIPEIQAPFLLINTHWLGGYIPQ